MVNSLLAALPAEDYRSLLGELEPVAPAGEVLHEPGERIREVYFPGAGHVSLLMVMADRKALEVGLVGREGTGRRGRRAGRGNFAGSCFATRVGQRAADEGGELLRGAGTQPLIAARGPALYVCQAAPGKADRGVQPVSPRGCAPRALVAADLRSHSVRPVSCACYEIVRKLAT